MLEQYKKEIENYIIDDKLGDAMKRLNEILKDEKLRDEIIGHNRKFNATEREKRTGTLENEYYTTTISKIQTAILTIKRELKDDDLRDDLEIKESRFERLCVVAEPDSEHKQKFEKLLNTNYFKDVIYCDYEQVKNQDVRLTDREIYIFDYKEDQEDLLKTLLKKQDGPPVLIFIRGQLRWLFEPEYKDRYATANSIFTFHSRLSEILETLKWLER